MISNVIRRLAHYIVQDNTCLAITGVITGISRERLYRELGSETLNDRRWSRKALFFQKIIKGFFPFYLHEILCFLNVQHFQTRSKSTKIIKQVRARTRVFENSFFPYYIKEWLRLDGEIRSIESSKQFNKTILDFTRPKENSI